MEGTGSQELQCNGQHNESTKLPGCGESYGDSSGEYTSYVVTIKSWGRVFSLELVDAAFDSDMIS